MELWIRSQDREKFMRVDYFYLEQNSIIGYSQSTFTSPVLAKYKRKERALEVLDEIQRILKPIIKSYTPLTESKEDYKNHCMKTELVGYETTYDIVAPPTYVYEMPKE